MPRPTLSVVIPTRNYGHYLGDCLDALLSQSALPDEILVVDDASSDGTADVVAAARGRDARIRLLRLDQHAGVFAALAHGIAHAHGDCLYLHGADDMVRAGFVEDSLAALDAHPEAGLCCGDPLYLDEPTGRLRQQPLGWAEAPRYFSPADLARVLGGQAIAGHTVIVRRRALEEAGGQRPALHWHADWFAWLVIGFRRGVCYIPRGLATARVHARAYSTRTDRDPREDDVFSALFRLLHDEQCHDVLPFFVRGDALAVHGAELVRWVLAHGCRDETTLALARRPIRACAENMDLRRATALASASFELRSGRWWSALREVAREANRQPQDVELAARVADIRRVLMRREHAIEDPDDPPTYDHVRRVAIFGAGEHGRTALRLATRCGWEVACFLDNSADRLAEVGGRPVIRPDALEPDGLDLLIVASVAWRDEMFAQAAALGYLQGATAIWFLDPVVVEGIRLSVDHAGT
jgi:glycosyltransferase involved in cell wall biosynthesis